MLLDRSLDNPELGGDLLVQHPGRDEPEDLALARRQGTSISSIHQAGKID